MDTNLADVKKVVETHHINELNAYLELGYVLITSASGIWSDSQEPYIKYSLGWTQDTPAPRPPLY